MLEEKARPTDYFCVRFANFLFFIFFLKWLDFINSVCFDSNKQNFAILRVNNLITGKNRSHENLILMQIFLFNDYAILFALKFYIFPIQ